MGGIAMGPILALIGEAGPEAVVPLGRGGNGSTGSTVILNIAGSVRTERELLAFIQEGRRYYNQKRPHSAKGYRTPTPEVRMPVGLTL